MTTLIIVTVITLSVSGVCSLFEAVLYSCRLGALEAAKEKPGRLAVLAARMTEMKRNIAAPIAAILILNTIANTAGATLAGMFARESLTKAQVAMYSIGLTLGILFLSEILPKTLGAVHWRSLWSVIVWPLTFIRVMLAPFIWATQKASSLVTRGHQPAAVTEEEILAMVSLGASEGHITQAESEMVRNIIDLENKMAGDIMTPRIVMFTLSVDTTVGEAGPKVVEAGFSRMPVYDDHPENIIGYVLNKDLHRARYKDDALPLKDLVKPITFVPQNANCLTLLNQFLTHRRHIAMVSDEYGGLAGMICLEDLVETLLGSEIVDETDRAIDMQKIALSRKRRKEARNGARRKAAEDQERGAGSEE